MRHQHVLALHKVAKSLGIPAKKPKGKFPIRSAAQVTKLAAVVENLGAAAYLGQAGNIERGRRSLLRASDSPNSREATLRPWMCESSPVLTDEQIESQIEALESEREKLRRAEGTMDPNLDQDAARLEELRVDLDRLWDLLRQRRALRSAGENPDSASERSADTVQKYWQ